MPDGEVVFEIRADAKDADKALDQFIQKAKSAGMDIDKAMASASKSAADSFNDISKSFSHAFDIERVKNFALDAMKQVVAFGKEAINAASDLEEVQNVVDVTFEESAGKVNAWAQNAAKSFGLTETQAKKFTSTLGAMMKSAGLTGDEITKMSTDMAGLAADMASFYNLDFDTAFQKIRSGISGETEPLKQLGINLSVANLEAFRLAQGLDKSYSSMTQGEQVVLRYQYLMQATADAQGDFARTSDSYANSLRLLETNIETLKTRLGTALVPVVSGFVSGINDILAAMQVDLPSETILDKFAKIDLRTEDKIAEIENTAASARATVDILDEITGKTYATDSLVSAVSTFGGAIGDLDAAMTTAKNGNYGATMEELAGALAKSSGLNADDWKTILGETANAINGFSVETTRVSEPLHTVIGEIEAEPSKYGLEAAKEKVQSAVNAIGEVSPATAEQKIGEINAIIETPPSHAGVADAKGLVQNALNDMQSVQTSIAQQKIEDINKIFEPEPTIGVVSAPPKIEGAVAQIETISTDGISSKISEIGEKLNTNIDETPPVITILDEIKAKAAEDIDTTKIDANISKISTAVAKAAPDQQGTVIQVLEGIPDALREAKIAVTANGEETVDWLGKAAEVANSLGEGKAAAWQAFVDSIGSEAVSGMLEAWAGASTAVNNMAEASNALGGFADADGASLAIQNLQELGLQVTSAEEAMAAWSGLLQSLVSDIPALGDIINAATGDIEGGTDALRDYIDKWEEYQKILAMQRGVEQKKTEHEQDTSVQDANMDVLKAQAALRLAQEEFSKFGMDYESTIAAINTAIANGTYMGYEYETAALNVQQAMAEVTRAQQEAAQAAEDYAEAGRILDAASSILAEGAEDAASSIGKIAPEAEAAAQAVLQNMAPALGAMADMYESTRESIKENVENMFDGFEFKMPELGGEGAPEAYNMVDSLKDQIEYMNEYMDLLEQAKQNGVNAEILSGLSSGSVEDAEYLKALADASSGEIERLNELYAEAKQKREEFADSLTATTLEGDETWNELQTTVTTAMSDLTTALGDPGPAAAANSTMEAILDAVKSRTASISEEIDAVLAQWARLEGMGLSGFSPNSGAGSANSGTPHAGGLDYVPFNGYLARLHEGESVLTREQSLAWRSYSQGAQNASALDYAALGGVIRDNTPKAGGNVYLDGMTVGRVISDRQADSYRMLERSGWQA